jgi:hypothetical protein
MERMKKSLFLSFVFFVFTVKTFSQVVSKPKRGYADDFVKSIETAHNAAYFNKNKAISFDIDITWGGKPNLQATVTSLTSSGKVKLQTANGGIVLFDGKDFYLNSDPNGYKRARFDIMTWHYFFFVPFKLRDKGVMVERDIDRLSEDTPYNTAKMTFAKGTGDSPDDWYVLYKNMQTNRLEGMAYIVTFGGKKPDEATPHAITYHDWTTLDGISFPSTWKFREWSVEKGFSTVLGEGKIKNIRWVKNLKGVFDVPIGSIKIAQ